jgi:NAD(P)-dependent dehydrogenase (short-subunit alcohol dehydrogenase family)
MADILLTGASRGIGQALARELGKGPDHRLVLVARDRGRLEALATEIERQGGWARAVGADLSVLSEARALGERLAGMVGAGAILIHNAGVWPHNRALTADGLELSFAVNHLGPLVMQRPLLEKGVLGRLMVVSAGLIAKGRFDPERTPTGKDFALVRTYCTTKLCFALATRDVAAAYPSLDVVALHPGVVRTDLGMWPGPMGWMLKVVKKGWEAPEACATRLQRILSRERWSTPGEARWLFEESLAPWPPAADNETTRRLVRETTAMILAERGL